MKIVISSVTSILSLQVLNTLILFGGVLKSEWLVDSHEGCPPLWCWKSLSSVKASPKNNLSSEKVPSTYEWSRTQLSPSQPKNNLSLEHVQSTYE